MMHQPAYVQLGKGGLLPHGAGGLNHINGLNGLAGFGPGVLSPAALAALAGSGGRGASTHQTHEMTVPNEIIGCVIGKGGSKVAEIRQLSGAMIRISNCEDRDAPANLDRTITISGNCESVALAQYLINMSMEVFRANLQMLEDQQLPPAQPAPQPRLLLPDSTPQAAAPPPAPGPVYAMAAAQTNTISNNNNTLQSLQQLQHLQYPQQPTLLKPYT